ncbi:unnamed protein product [Dracunculus medinensis]|uniref:SSD domain-containing protein n=1 Tax=Dracunculus medinensis TaxID=318479 RepID=A0A0N4U7B5_DRAME|nr:unnamed protein product [Dracunculus medinensis]
MSVLHEIEKRFDQQHRENHPVREPNRRSSILVGRRSLELTEEYGDKEPRFVKLIVKLYKQWGFIITKWAWLAVFTCLTLSVLGTLKILQTKQKNELTGYVPFEARSRVEFEQYTSFFAHSGLPIASYIFLAPKDGGSILRDDYLMETIKILNLAMGNVTMFNRDLNRSQSFEEFCISFCIANEPVRQFYNGWQIQKLSIERGDGVNDVIKLDYPTSSIFDKKFSLQPNFFGVELYDTKESSDDGDTYSSNLTDINESAANKSLSEQRMLTNMKIARIIALQFRAEHLPAWSTDDVKDWELRLVKFFEDEYKSDLLKIFVLSQTYIETEMVRAGASLLPYLTVGFFIMCTCSVVTVTIRAAYMHQNNFYKVILSIGYVSVVYWSNVLEKAVPIALVLTVAEVILAVMACITPLLACQTALAVLFLVGLRFSSILCVIPFLVLSIGVDSSYLMIHEWQRVTKEIHDGQKKPDNVLSEVGPAILISALTNILADGVGCWTSSPEIRLLCLGNLFSMFMAYIYQMTFYSGLMSIVGRLEIEGEKKNNNTMEISIKDMKVNIRRDSAIFQRRSSRFHDTSKLYISKYMRVYVEFMTQTITSLFIILTYLFYLFTSIWGITRININLTSQKLFAQDSPLIELDKLRVQYQVPTYTIATVFINKAGNLSDSSRIGLINKMVDEFEAIHGNWGPVGTMYFLRDFVKFEKEYQSGDYDYDSADDGDGNISTTTTTAIITPSNSGLELRQEDIEAFLSWPEYSIWNGFVYLGSDNDTAEYRKKFKEKLNFSAKNISRFFFITAYKGEWLIDWVERGNLLKKWRKIVDDPIYRSFHASVFHEDGVFLDLIDNMTTDTWQSILGTLICMAAVCFLFLRSPITVAIATSSVLSICIGILGIGSWLGIDLDPITMAAMIISIGFSVDIPAHVSYHYYKACESGPNATSQARLGNCLSLVAFPAVQAALSTIFCIISLLFVPIYMSKVFVKTMVVCVLLCNIHGLIFLPAILSTVDQIISKICRNKPKQKQGPRKKQLRSLERYRISAADTDPTRVDRPTIVE